MQLAEQESCGPLGAPLAAAKRSLDAAKGVQVQLQQSQLSLKLQGDKRTMVQVIRARRAGLRRRWEILGYEYIKRKKVRTSSSISSMASCTVGLLVQICVRAAFLRVQCSFTTFLHSWCKCESG